MVEEFRVWDKDLAKYLEGEEIEKELKAEFEAKGNGREVMIKQITPARYKFELNTYSKDKNDNEIFVGDIVRVKGGKEPAEVFRMEGMFVLRTSDGEIYRDEGSQLFVPLGWINPTYMEIIGNIQESPEKLTSSVKIEVKDGESEEKSS